MKKFTLSLVSLMLTVLLCSCGIPADKQGCFCIPESFVCDVIINDGEKSYEGQLEKSGVKYVLTVTSPESLRGLVVTSENGEISAAFGSSEMTVKPQDGFFLGEITEFIDRSIGDESVQCEETENEYIVKNEKWELHFEKAMS